MPQKVDDLNQSDDGSLANPENYHPFFLERMSKNMSLVGLFTVIFGAINCLSIIGALIGVPFIIAGLRLRESAERFEYYAASKNEAALRDALEKQNGYFRILKILYAIYIVVFILAIIFYAFFFAALLGNGGFWKGGSFV